MTVMCERDTQKPGNHCVKCGGTWVTGTPLPACDAANSFVPAPEPVGIKVAEPATMQSSGNPEDVLRLALGLQSDEPFFILRGSDLLADWLVERWAMNAESQGCNAKTVQAAREKARAIRAWPERKYPA